MTNQAAVYLLLCVALLLGGAVFAPIWYRRGRRRLAAEIAAAARGYGRLPYPVEYVAACADYQGTVSMHTPPKTVLRMHVAAHHANRWPTLAAFGAVLAEAAGRAWAATAKAANTISDYANPIPDPVGPPPSSVGFPVVSPAWAQALIAHGAPALTGRRRTDTVPTKPAPAPGEDTTTTAPPEPVEAPAPTEPAEPAAADDRHPAALAAA